MFILHAQRTAAGDGDDLFGRYRAYLASVRDRFPPSAWALVHSQWYFDWSDPRALHDARLEEACLSRTQDDNLTLRIRLLGAYRDGIAELVYSKVAAYALRQSSGQQGGGAWLYDEFRLSKRGLLLHEIELWSSRRLHSWWIECADVVHVWRPHVPSGPRA